MKTALVPIVKNKTGDTSDKNNYRPIAIVTAASKLFEICILKVLDAYLITHDHQFGFKSKHSTDMCIFTVKSVIKYYTEQNTAVYTCLLDARKAFDRVNHWTLFAKLIDTQAPLLIVRVLLFWYQMQNVCIKWGNSYSHYFTICNGVRQGGILSPRLFALYVNQLTDRLLSCNAGCYINDMCINHVMYADDICLLAPSASAMQSLLDVCYDYGSDNDILFNPIKSVYTIFKPKAYKLYLPPVFIGSDALKYVAESKYLGFSFCDSKQDDNDILRQMRTVYAKSNTLLRTFSHCSTDVKVTLFQSYCTALYCPFLWSDYKKSTFRKIRVAFRTRMFVRWGDTCSTSFCVTNGVKQGGIISPMLFNLYMDDLSLMLNCSGIGGYIGTSFINHLCYADDLCLISLSSSGMQHLLNICNEYAATQKLLYNGSKSFSLCFKKNTLKVSAPSFYLDQMKIPTVKQCRYLGITISTQNSDIDLKRQMRKLYANVNLLLRKFSKCSVGVKCFLFKTYCSNLYCAPMWFDCTKAALKKLKIAYNNSLRRFMFLPWRNSATEMFANLGIHSFDEMLRIFVFSFRSRVTASHNQLIFGLCTAHCSVYSKLWAWWNSLLHI